MKRRFTFFAAVGLWVMALMITATPSGAALPAAELGAMPLVEGSVALRPVEIAPKPLDSNPLLPIVDFLVDDGNMEYQFGLNTQGHGLVLLGINRFTLSAGQYPLVLTEISVLFPDVAHAFIDLTGRNVDLLVYRDTSGSGQPTNASKIYQSTVQVQTLSPNFSVYPVSIPLQGPGDIYIGFSNIYDHGGGVQYSYPYGIDNGQSQQRSWIIGNYNGSDPNYNDISNNQLVSLLDNMGMSYIGNFLIRGKGEVGATPMPTATRTHTPTPGPTVTRPPAYVLYDQYDHISPIYASNSQQYEPSMQPYTSYLADDFVVPAGQTWYLDEVDVAGRIDGGMGPVASFNVMVYTSGGTVPGSPVYTAANAPYTLQAQGEYHISLLTPAMLATGTYWLMVQANIDYSTAGQFMWYNRAAQSYNQAAWYNPGDGWGTTCTEAWGTRWQCTGDFPEPDQVYRLLGTSLGGSTPAVTNTPTGTPTVPVVTNTPTRTPTAPVITNTPTRTPTGPLPTSTPSSLPITGTLTASVTPTVAPTACSIEFNDVLTGSTFYPYVRCLACLGIVGGYSDGSFKPNTTTSRGQVSKVVANAAGFSEPVSGQLFEDVPPGSTFHEYVQRLASRGYIAGYTCGGVGEPCGVGNLPYFRPSNNVTRGQLSKIAANAAAFNGSIPVGTQTFADVPEGSTYHLYVERLLLNRPGVIGGYQCGGVGEPCDLQNRAYFRPTNQVTRGQTSKIVANTFYPDCQPPARR